MAMSPEAGAGGVAGEAAPPQASSWRCFSVAPGRLSEPPVSPGVGGGGRPRSPAYLLPASVPGGGRASGRASGPRPPRTAPRAEGMPAAHALASAPSPQKFDELLHLASKGQHANVDMLVQDVYGGAHQTLGLSGNLIASSFGKSATADRGTCPPRPPRAGGPAPGLARQRLPVPAEFCKEDMAKSLLHMISNDIGQLACLHARLHRLDRVYFGGFFIRGHPVTMRTITYSINFFSKVTELRPPPRPRLRCPQRSSRVLARGASEPAAGGRGGPPPALLGPLPLSSGGSSALLPGAVAVLELGTMPAESTLRAVSPMDELSFETCSAGPLWAGPAGGGTGWVLFCGRSYSPSDFSK